MFIVALFTIPKCWKQLKCPSVNEWIKKLWYRIYVEDGGEIGGSRVHFPSTPVKYLADLRSRANSQQYSSIYEDQRPKIEDTERSDGKKSAQGQ